MKKLVLLVGCFVFTAAAHANVAIPENNGLEKVVFKIDCGKIYKNIHDFMKLRGFSDQMSDDTANAARQDCYDQNEKEEGLNPDCK